MSKLNEKIHLLMEMNVFCEHYNSLDGFIPDWNDGSQEKHGLMITGEVIPAWSFLSKNLVFGLAVSSEERAEQMKEEFKERLKLYY